MCVCVCVDLPFHPWTWNRGITTVEQRSMWQQLKVSLSLFPVVSVVVGRCYSVTSLELAVKLVSGPVSLQTVLY